MTKNGLPTTSTPTPGPALMCGGKKQHPPPPLPSRIWCPTAYLLCVRGSWPLCAAVGTPSSLPLSTLYHTTLSMVYFPRAGGRAQFILSHMLFRLNTALITLVSLHSIVIRIWLQTRVAAQPIGGDISPFLFES
jgi:hypothetical protein